MDRKLTIIIPTLGHPENLSKSVRCIMENVRPEDEFETIIVKGVKGFAQPVNRAIRLANPTSDILLVHDDAFVKEPFITKFQKVVQSDTGLISKIRIGYGFEGHRDLWRSSLDFCYIPRHTIDKVGLFDENFEICAEDLDYCYRVEKAGLKQVEIPLNVEHRGNTTVETIKDYDGMKKRDNKRFLEKWFN